MKLAFASVASCALLAACAASPKPTARGPEFLTATAIVEHSPPAIAGSDPSESLDAESDELASEGRASSAESEESLPAPKPTRVAPGVIVAQANDHASQVPEEDGFLNALMSYAYEPGRHYTVITSPMHVTDIKLEPGEELPGNIVGGDPVRWWVDVGPGVVDGMPQTHVFIKPTRAGLRTNVILVTNRRTYYLSLESVENTCDEKTSGPTTARGVPASPAAECTAFMLGVQWTYPQASSESAQFRFPSTEPPQPSAAAADVSALHLDYAIEVTNGRPPWKPRAVFDDGVRTYIRFDRRILSGEAPVLFVIERGEAQIVNYRVKDTLYIVDRLFEQAELRLGKDDQDVVRLRRRGPGNASAAARNRATSPAPARLYVKRTPAP